MYLRVFSLVPARAGMIPLVYAYAYRMYTGPRTRGDDPEEMA